MNQRSVRNVEMASYSKINCNIVALMAIVPFKLVHAQDVKTAILSKGKIKMESPSTDVQISPLKGVDILKEIFREESITGITQPRAREVKFYTVRMS